MAWIRVDSVWKRFNLQKDRAGSVGQLLWRMVPGRHRLQAEPFWALRDVSLEMPNGTSLGIIGHNGAGKSTMLKLLTRTMQPTSGGVSVHGRVSALIELGAGFHPDFTGRENIVLNASILGIGRRDIQRRMSDIIEFAGIASFIDTPVKYYSSGMQARLGFSVAIHVQPELLIVDEILAVGDEAFQQRCMDRIFALKREGVSILLVSHDLISVERLMDRAVWLDHGQVRAWGLPHDVIRTYRDSLRPDLGDKNAPPGPFVSGATLTIGDGRIYSLKGSSDTLLCGDPAALTISVHNAEASPTVGHLGVTFRRPDGLALSDISSYTDGMRIDFPPGDHAVTLTLAAIPFVAGSYEIAAVLLDEQGTRINHRDPLLSFIVRAATRQSGLVEMPHKWQAG